MSDEMRRHWRDLLVEIWEYYQDHGAGGYLHVVLDDGNLESSYIELCRQRALGHRCEWVNGPIPESERHNYVILDGGPGHGYWKDVFVPNDVDERALHIADKLLLLTDAEREELYSNYRLYAMAAPRPGVDEIRGPES